MEIIGVQGAKIKILKMPEKLQKVQKMKIKQQQQI